MLWIWMASGFSRFSKSENCLHHSRFLSFETRIELNLEDESNCSRRRNFLPRRSLLELYSWCLASSETDVMNTFFSLNELEILLAAIAAPPTWQKSDKVRSFKNLVI